MTPLTGGCLCGGVRWELSERPTHATYCHCTRCQRRTGTAAAPNARPRAGTFAITQGEERVKRWRHPDGGWVKAFCGTCGSALFSENPDDPDEKGVRMGGFDTDPGLEFNHRAYVDSAATWEPIPDDGLPRYPQARPPDA